MKRSLKVANVLLPITAILTVILIWCFSSLLTNNEFLLPSVSETAKEFIKLFSDSGFYYSLLMTVLKSLISFVASFLIALGLGILSVRHDGFKRFISPIISVMRALPTVAVVLLLLVWTDPFVAPIVVTALVVLPTVYTDAVNDLSAVDNKQAEMCRLFKVKSRDVIFKVYIPQIAPPMLITVGSSLSLNLKLMVAAEVLAATGNSIGNMLNVANINFETARLMAIVIVMIILGLIIEATFNAVSKRAGVYL